MSRRGMPQGPPATTPARALVGSYTDDQEADAPAAQPRDRAVTHAQRAERTKLTAEISTDAVEELRDAVVWLPSQGVQATVAGIIEQALRAELDRLRQQYREGDAFPPRRGAPRVGRPIGS